MFAVPKMVQIAKSISGVSGPSHRAVMDEAHRQLYAEYPNVMFPVNSTETQWAFNSIGGSLAEIRLLYASLWEYVALWGSPLASGGFSGRYGRLDVWDIMLGGRMRSYSPTAEDPDVFEYINKGEGSATCSAKTYQTSVLRHGEGRHFLIEDGTYMIDYGRGNILSVLSSGVALGHRYVTGDRWSSRNIRLGFAKLALHNLTRKRRRHIARYAEQTDRIERELGNSG